MAAGKSPPGEMVDVASGVKDDGNCFNTGVCYYLFFHYG